MAIILPVTDQCMDKPDANGNARSPTGLTRRVGRPSRLLSASDYLHRQHGRIGGLVAHGDRLTRINRLLRAYLPPHLRDHARVVAIGPEWWTVQTESAAWATRLRYLLPSLQKQLGTELGQAVPPLRLRIEPLPEEHSDTMPRRLTLTRQNAHVLEGAADSIDDCDLGAALRRLARHARGR